MYIYEFITPSDAISFKADDDKIAYACAVILGNGKAGCKRFDEKGEVNLGTMLIFCTDVEKEIKDYLGVSLDEFLDVKENRDKMAECCLSFAYGNIEDRKTYDDAMEAITDETKRKEFQAKHEDRNRSSMSKWVKYAWQVGENLKKPKPKEKKKEKANG